MTWTGLDGRLAVKITKSHSLVKELGEVRATLLKESKQHDALRDAVLLVYSNLELAPAQETSLLAFCAIQIMDGVHDIARGALRFGVNRSFTIARSHYENIDLATMSQCFTPDNFDTELEDIKKEVAPLAHDIFAKIEDEIIPRKIS